FGEFSGVVRNNLGDTNADVTVFSTTQSLSFDANDFSGASLRLGYEQEIVPNSLFEISAEQEFGSNAQGPNISAGLRIKF
uniref:hypothetical protein n=1 Tax=uncultured Ruegeria sp. TaxID=259304 RepID=UPI00260219E2